MSYAESCESESEGNQSDEDYVQTQSPQGQVKKSYRSCKNLFQNDNDMIVSSDEDKCYKVIPDSTSILR